MIKYILLLVIGVSSFAGIGIFMETVLLVTSPIAYALFGCVWGACYMMAITSIFDQGYWVMSEVASMKYVCTKDENGKEEIFTFPKSIDHDRFANTLCDIGPDFQYREPVSAGFVTRRGKCFGRSETLDLDSRPEDSDILLMQYV